MSLGPRTINEMRATSTVSESVRTPVLVIGFNRPEHLAVLLDRLREVRPQRVYFAVDGPREQRPGEATKVAEVRSLIDAIDWIPEKRTLFHGENLGCGLGVSTAITWFFEHEAEGIICEDDIIPDPSFFPYCAELLERYRDEDRVFAISGCNFVPPDYLSRPDLPYRFSQVPHIWGWATWRRSWEQYELDIENWRSRLPMRDLFQRAGRSLTGATYWASVFRVLARKEVDTWDGQLVLTSMAANQWTATSNTNLIRNIGFDDQATHTFEDRDELTPVIPVALPLAEVPVKVDELADTWTRTHHIRATPSGMMDQFRIYAMRRLGRKT